MAILSASNVGQSFGEYDVFGGVNVSIPQDGKIGLVGPNGVGKTTLLLILAGQATPSSGQVYVAKGSRIGYLSQESSDAFIGQSARQTVFEEMVAVFEPLKAVEARLRQLEADMAADELHDTLLEEYSRLQMEYEIRGGYEYETRVRMVLTGLGFRPDAWSQPLTQLSGGQKTRVLLGRLLLESPDLLILDEPTNHLDVQAIEWLESTLTAWPGAVLVVSHDRYFLDRVANTIWEMSTAGVESYRGNYSAYLTQRQDRWERLQREYESFQERIAKEMDFIRRNIAGQRTQMAWGKLSRLSREVEAVRAGGLGAIGDLSSKGWSRISDELDLRRPAATLAELQAAVAALPAPTRPPVVNMRLNAAYRSGKIVLRATDLTVGYPGRPLFTVEELELHRLETAALIGPNGTGKTTFLKVVLGLLEPLAGNLSLGASLKVGYFAQAQEALNPQATVLDELLRHKEMLISEARNYLARYLFRGDEVFSLISTLSGGERARLALAILVLEEANFLLLDEPTNHLDIPSQEVLQAALESFDGTILLVTHDRYLVDRLASQIWALRQDDGSLRLEVFDGPYRDYLAARAARPVVVEVEASSSNGDGVAAPSRLSKNELRRRAEALETVEADIATTENAITRLAEALQSAAAAQDFGELQRLTADYEATERKLEQLFGEWETMTHERASDHWPDG
ncbi:MAG: ABC-F family ATP-binding cassette domain-containing protein [Candidatus Promineofilum sp.]|nr:ABC-F family ATP-binding cassette domain-containing protein [Promineifilum sp.]